MTSTDGSNGNDTIPLGLYLWRRIREVGVRNIMGVPGDFNLTLLDHVYNVDGLKWIGNSNELNAAYAADGYARVKDGAGCIVTTHGVGEMSAINGIAGAMTEQVKVIHVVGQTARTMQKNHQMIHHSIGLSPDHQIFNHASRGFRVAAAEIQEAEDGPAEIDRVIRECFVKSCPVYIFLPIDLVDVPVPSTALQTPINLSVESDTDSLDAAVHAVEEALYSAKHPVIFVDCLVQRHNAVAELKKLVDMLQIPVYSSNMGKGLVDETHPNYVGIYNGVVSDPGLANEFKKSDLILLLGSLPSDTNSAGFTRTTPPEKTIAVDTTKVTIKGGKVFESVGIKVFLDDLSHSVSADKVAKAPKPSLPEPPLDADRDSKDITQSWIWHRIAKFLRPHDVIFGETGTAAFGIPDVTFPKDTNWITQTYYGSIGYATPAAFGAEVALTELAEFQGRPRGRTVLVTGDGSLMLTIQEIGSMIHRGMKPVIFLINNSGYTIERVIHGAHQSYNDISPMNYSFTLQALGMPEQEAKKNFHRAGNKAELEEILAKKSVQDPQAIQIVEVIMDAMDVPWRLSTQIATKGPNAVKEMRESGFKLREPLPEGI